MSAEGTGFQINRSELQRHMQGESVNPTSKTENKKPSKGSKVLKIVLTVIAAAYFLLLFFGKFIFPANSEILQSLNVFSDMENPNKVIRVISLAIITLSISGILRLLIARMAANKTLTKRTGVAVIELLENLVKYAAVIVLVFLILSAMGVDTAELLAGLGILSLVLGLGMTSLIEDIVAGIFIIAERLFDVGDIIVVDDFRGTVLSVGIRSTQIEDEGGDVLILRNSDISSLVNMTSQLSYAICDIPINSEESFEHVEEVINNSSFRDLSKQFPEIEKGPFYLGLSEITEQGGQIITFVALCKESNKYWIQRVMNRELKLLFDHNGIRLGEIGDD